MKIEPEPEIIPEVKTRKTKVKIEPEPEIIPEVKIKKYKVKVEPKRKKRKVKKTIEVEEYQDRLTEKFTADIKGVPCEGIMVKFEDRSIYLCQNFIVGAFIHKRLRKNYKFSIFVGYGEVDTLIVKNFKIIN